MPNVDERVSLSLGARTARGMVTFLQGCETHETQTSIVSWLTEAAVALTRS